MFKYTTVFFTWEDGVNSTESFKNNGEFYKYLLSMKEEKKYPIKLETQNSDWINE
jgi:hypothetical protein